MAPDAQKAPSSGTPSQPPQHGEQQQTTSMPAFVPPFNGAYPQPPPGAYPPLYAYAPPSEGDTGSNGPGGYLMAFPPPGMVYAYPPPPPPPGQAFPPFPHRSASPAPSPPRAKRKQVKMACTNCAAACKRCDEARPCDRCIRYSIAATCVDGQRKERKKGIKRGPYKRKNKSTTEELSYPDADWAQGPPHQIPGAPIPLPPPHEGGYYPYYLPPGFAPPPQGQEGAGEGSGAPAGGANQPVLQYYITHPPPNGFPAAPFGHFPYPPPPPQPQQQQQSQEMTPAESTENVIAKPERGEEGANENKIEAPVADKKKRARKMAGEKSKGKKSKVLKTGANADADVDANAKVAAADVQD